MAWARLGSVLCLRFPLDRAGCQLSAFAGRRSRWKSRRRRRRRAPLLLHGRAFPTVPAAARGGACVVCCVCCWLVWTEKKKKKKKSVLLLFPFCFFLSLRLGNCFTRWLSTAFVSSLIRRAKEKEKKHLKTRSVCCCVCDSLDLIGRRRHPAFPL